MIKKLITDLITIIKLMFPLPGPEPPRSNVEEWKHWRIEAFWIELFASLTLMFIIILGSIGIQKDRAEKEARQAEHHALIIEQQ